MIVYDKEQKQIVIPNGLGNVIVINQGGECPECPDCPECPECNLEDKMITPSMGDRDDNGYIITTPSEGFDGMERVVLNPTTIYNEGVEEGKNQGTTTTYPTIKDIYNTEDVNTEVYFKATVAVCLHNGSTNYRMIVTDHTGAFYIDTTQPYDVGDECIFTGAVKKTSGTNMRYMNKPIIEVISKGNYVVMPTDAVELTNLSDLYIPNEYGNAEMKYLYFQGEVQRITTNGNIDITAPESVASRGYIGLRGSKEEWRSNLVVGDNVRVYMFTANTDGYFIPTDLIKLTGGGDCNLEDKAVDPTVDNVENGWLYIYPSEGYNGMSRILVNTGNLEYSWYNEGYEQGRAEGGGGDCPDCPDGDCTLTTRTITQNGTYRASDSYGIAMLNFSQNGAFDSRLRVNDDTYIEFYFKFKDELTQLMSFFGCENNDWDDTTFAARYYEGNIGVKMGNFERGFSVEEYGLNDGEVHKMKIGPTYGIEIDGQLLVTYDDILNGGISFEPSNTRTIYIGAINSPNIDDNGLGLFWRPFNGYIGPVTIYGKTEGNENVTYNYVCGDYGWWGEYKILQTNERIENIYREPGAVTLDSGQYNPNADGFSEVEVNLPLNPLDIRMDGKTRTEIPQWYGLAGFSEVNVDATELYNRAADEGKNLVLNNLDTLEVTENGTYTAGIYEEMKYILNFTSNTGVFVTDFSPTLNDTAVNDGGFEIEVQAKVNSNEEGDKFIVGCAAERYWENAGIDTPTNNVVLQAHKDATCLFMSGCRTFNMSTINDEWVTYRITENGLDYKRELQSEWSHIDWDGTRPRDVWNNKSNDVPIAIGGLNTLTDGLFNDFQGSIRYVRIKQGDYDKTWIPSDNGDMIAEGTDQRISVQNGDNPEFAYDYFKEGNYGWKNVIVNLAGNIGTLNYQEITYSEYLALGDNVDDNTIYLMER